MVYGALQIDLQRFYWDGQIDDTYCVELSWGLVLWCYLGTFVFLISRHKFGVSGIRVCKLGAMM